MGAVHTYVQLTVCPLQQFQIDIRSYNRYVQDEFENR